MSKQEKLILRYNLKQIMFHWLFALSFFVLTVTGLFLLIPSLAIYAGGGTSSVVHRGAGVVLMLSVLLYYLFEREGFMHLIKESFSYDKDDIQWLKQIFSYIFGKTKGMPPSGRLNGGEKFHHAMIIITFVAISISGLFLWLGSNMSAKVFLIMIWVHNIAMFIMVCLTIGHIYFTFLYGALNHMITGYTTEKYAVKHEKWLKALNQENAKTFKM